MNTQRSPMKAKEPTNKELKRALALSIKKWKILYDDPQKWGRIGIILPKLLEHTWECPLCTIFLRGEELHKKCPLYEEESIYRIPGDQCCGAFHQFWRGNRNKEVDKAKEHALSILDKLEKAQRNNNK